ncbi:MAG: SUMF1/EgtB/PvdO family nonheme iron enzyme [Cyanobacteria bacterium P01_A01_bin.114]
MPLPLPSSPLPAKSDFDRQFLLHALQQCRQGTLALVNGLGALPFRQQAHPDFSPVGWHLGHIAFTESLWILEHLAQQPCPFPYYRQLFAADGLPKSERQNLPGLDEIQAFLATVRYRVEAYLRHAPIEKQLRLWRWLLQHESQHGETIALIMALHQLQGQVVSLRQAVPLKISQVAPPPLALMSDMVHVPAGEFWLGNDSWEAIDNEQPSHVVHLDDFWIDRTPVTCAHYRQFIEAGGYENPQWWSPQGWRWQQAAGVRQPLYWSADFIFSGHPVSGVSWYEAEAYARFVGKRLPTEVEWEKAAAWHPERSEQRYPWGDEWPTVQHCNHDHHVGHTTLVGAFEKNVSPVGCYDLLGNVWEWTDTWFNGYPGFRAYPYRGYSQVYFDQAHRVLRGGSWATRPWALRNSFRNWYQPHVRELFMGFRCAQSAEP